MKIFFVMSAVASLRNQERRNRCVYFVCTKSRMARIAISDFHDLCSTCKKLKRFEAILGKRKRI